MYEGDGLALNLLPYQRQTFHQQVPKNVSESRVFFYNISHTHAQNILSPTQCGDVVNMHVALLYRISYMVIFVYARLKRKRKLIVQTHAVLHSFIIPLS